MTNKEDSFEQHLHIDEYRLDREWLAQPKHYAHYGQLHAESRKAWELTKNQLEVTKAQLDRAIRSDPEDYGISKVTETVIASTIILQEEYQQAYQNMVAAKHQVDVYAAVMEAFDQRKHALQNLVSLHLSGYFAQPKAPAGNEEEVDLMTKRAIRRRHRRRHDDAE